MSNHVLRKFLYLDTALLDDYLAGLGVSTSDEEITETSQNEKGISGGAKIGGMGASGKGAKVLTTEVHKIFELTDALKFQKLYAALEKDNAFSYWECMNESNWEELERNEILEAEVELVQSKIGIAISQIGLVSDMMDVMTTLAPDEAEKLIDKETIASISGISSVSKLEGRKGIPLQMNLLLSKEYKFVAYLRPEFLRVAREELLGEATIYIKVQRKLQPNESIDLFDITSGPEKLAQNRRQKRAMTKGLSAEIRGTVKAPAAVVIPIVIYQ